MEQDPDTDEEEHTAQCSNAGVGPATPADGQPGPRWCVEAVTTGIDIVIGADITKLWMFLATADVLQAATFAAQEHGVIDRNQEAAKATAHKRGFCLVAGPVDETGHAGVAALVRSLGTLTCQALPCSFEEQAGVCFGELHARARPLGSN